MTEYDPTRDVEVQKLALKMTADSAVGLFNELEAVADWLWECGFPSDWTLDTRPPDVVVEMLAERLRKEAGEDGDAPLESFISMIEDDLPPRGGAK